jgi:heme exporter protein A
MNRVVESPIIVVRNIRKKLNRKTILDGLSLEVNAGEIVAVLGPNGAGKTTFLRVLSTLMRVDEGAVQLDGYSLPEDAKTIRKLIGFVSHQPLLYADLTAVENLRFYARLYNLKNMEVRIGKVLQMVGLSARRNDPVRIFSRGMQQRLSLGRAILHEPAILLLDEPFNGLDQEASETFADYITTAASSGCTVVLTSHDLTGVEKMANRFDILVYGKIVSSLQRSHLPQGDLSSVYRNTLQSLSNGGKI